VALTRPIDLRRLVEDLVANGKVESQEIERLRRELYADGRIGRPEADALVELHKRIQRPSPGFEQFFYRAIKDYLLGNNRIGPGETAWLRQMLPRDGRLSDLERKFLHQLRGEARETSPEFDALCNECLR
jgi:hypothetical protein